ncbi:MAG: glycosyltransferase family 9 protein [Chloroflexaceae bacterium]
MTAEIANGVPFPLTRAVIRRIAVFRALFLGDLLCAVPALRALRRHFPLAEITLIGLPWAADLARRLSYIDQVLPFPGYPGITEVDYQAAQTQAFLQAARANPYDLAIQMHGNGTNSNGFVADLGARMSLGYRQGNDRRLTVSRPYRPAEHEIGRWLRLVRAVGVPADDPRTEFPTSHSEADHALELLRPLLDRPGPLIGLHAGGKDPARRWPPERFAQLADALVAQTGARIVLTGGPGERAITAAVRQAMHASALDLAGQTDLGSFAEVIARLDLLITNDTGASHLAAARGTRSVVLFGPSRPERWAPPDRARHRVIDALALAGSAIDPRTALRRLPVGPVLAAGREMLRRDQAGEAGSTAQEVACGDERF